METIDFMINRREKSRSDFIALKIDLEEKISQIIEWENCFNFCQMRKNQEYGTEEVHGSALVLRRNRPSFISPGYALNCYIDAYIEDVFWDDIKYELNEETWVSSSLRETKLIIEMQNCLIAIKSGIDKLISLFSLYYKGISPHSTFGRVDEKGKSRGFMSYVLRYNDSDPIFSYILDEYSQWIQDCVVPRDTVIHYSDFGAKYSFGSDFGGMCPSGLNEKDGEEISVDIDKLVNYVNRFYSFYHHVIMALCSKERSQCDKEKRCEMCYLDKNLT